MLGMIMFSIGPMLITLTQELQITITKAGLLFGIISLVMGIFALISGTVSAVSKRIGLKLPTCLGITIMALGGIISGILPNYTVVFIGRVLFAVGAGLFFPMLGAVIMQWFSDSDKELLLVNSVNFSGKTAGLAIALLITTPLIEAFGWRATLILYGAFCGVIAILSWSLLKERSTAVSSVVQDTSRVPRPAEKSEMTASDVLKMKETWLLSFIYLADIVSSFALATFLPAYYVKERGMTMAVASSWTSITFFIGVPASIIGGIWASRSGSRRPFIIGDGIILSIGYLGAVLLSGSICVLFLILAGIGFFFFLGTFFTIPMEIKGMTPKAAGLMIGIIMFIGLEAGFITPVIVGWIEKMTGSLKGGLLLLSPISFLMVILPVFLKETGPKAKTAKNREKIGDVLHSLGGDAV